MDIKGVLEKGVSLYRKFDPAGEGYDYETAMKEGVRPGKDKHWGSRAPQSGQILKGKKHPTFDLAEKGEKEAGYEMYEGEDGKTYSRKKVPLK